MKHLCLAALLVCVYSSAFAQAPATPAPTATTAAPVSNGSSVGDRNATYTDRIPPGQILELDANGDKFRARHIADLSGEPRGAAIILHDSAQNPAWPFTAAALSDDLPLHGWDTLSIELPAPDQEDAAPTAAAATPPAPATPPIAPAPTASTPGAPAPATSGGIAATGTEPRAQARIAAALKFYIDQKTKNVVLIGFGSGAIRSAEFLRQYATANSNKLEPISALVMVMPTNKLTGIDTNLPKILPSTTVPALDLILDSEPQAKIDAEARRRAVLHQRERIYRQLQLPPLNQASDAQHSLMVKRVRAWLQQNANAEIAQEK